MILFFAIIIIIFYTMAVIRSSWVERKRKETIEWSIVNSWMTTAPFLNDIGQKECSSMRKVNNECYGADLIRLWGVFWSMKLKFFDFLRLESTKQTFWHTLSRKYFFKQKLMSKFWELKLFLCHNKRNDIKISSAMSHAPSIHGKVLRLFIILMMS